MLNSRGQTGTGDQNPGFDVKAKRLGPVSKPNVWTQSPGQKFGLSLKTKPLV